MGVDKPRSLCGSVVLHLVTLRVAGESSSVHPQASISLSLCTAMRITKKVTPPTNHPQASHRSNTKKTTVFQVDPHDDLDSSLRTYLSRTITNFRAPHQEATLKYPQTAAHRMNIAPTKQNTSQHRINHPSSYCLFGISG
eukprot:2321421-Amphidinium_carterae.1